MNQFRVDRVKSGEKTPCGMNAIIYCGDNEFRARQVLRDARTGLDPWSQKSKDYGVLLSRYSESDRCYVPLQFRPHEAESMRAAA